ncbi:hypothetical protein FRC12_024920 [Ceratobasidium sp. 428]|nr:hypothetical protein FRC12_024920 [Ceratobasidium sp. 428]
MLAAATTAIKKMWAQTKDILASRDDPTSSPWGTAAQTSSTQLTSSKHPQLLAQSRRFFGLQANAALSPLPDKLPVQEWKFKILICTEALTMGAVFRNMKPVINFLTPGSART